MAIDKLSLYNAALMRAGAERLSAVNEAVEVRYKLDEIWDLNGPEYCFRLAKPAFARKTAKLTTASTTTDHGIEYIHALPADYIASVGLFSDADLDTRIQRFLFEDNDTLYAEFATVWLRYVSDAYITTLTNWTADFVNVVAAYLAWRLAQRISPDKAEDLKADFESEVESSLSQSNDEEPANRPQKSSTTLSNDWLPLYNNALEILKRPRLTTLTDERQDRVALDTAREGLLVRSLIETYPWSFARKVVQISVNTALEPSFGYSRGFNKPTDIYRLHGLFVDGNCRAPLKNYREEESVWYCEAEYIYLDYIPDTLETQPSSWPAYFWRLVAAQVANDAAGQIPAVPTDVIDRAETTLKARRDEAENTDFSQSPPQRVHTGSWVRARRGGYRHEPYTGDLN